MFLPALALLEMPAAAAFCSIMAGIWSNELCWDFAFPLMRVNLRSAYVHVIADAATSILAIIALGGGMLFGWSWLDPTMGLVGAGVVGVWAFGLLKGTSRVLLDREMDDPVVGEIRNAIETPSSPGGTRIADLHVWRVGKGSFACALTVVTADPAMTPGHVRRQLAVHHEIVHATIEVQQCS